MRASGGEEARYQRVVSLATTHVHQVVSGAVLPPPHYSANEQSAWWAAYETIAGLPAFKSLRKELGI
jgi:hypothetical protein